MQFWYRQVYLRQSFLCCVFWPAFRCLQRLKAGLTKVLKTRVQTPVKLLNYDIIFSCNLLVNKEAYYSILVSHSSMWCLIFVNHFVWLLGYSVYLTMAPFYTKERKFRFRMSRDDECKRCGEVETYRHLSSFLMSILKILPPLN